MAKRFIDTKLWDNAWFRRLSPKYKSFWFYLLGKCDHAGIWDADWEAAEFMIGEKIIYDELPAEIKSKLTKIKDDKQFYIPSFVEFQYGELKPHSKPHLSVIKRLDDKNLLNGNLSVNDTLKDKYKDKYKDKDKKKDKDEREKDFMNKCKSLQEKNNIDDVMLLNFVEYWTESNLNGKLMKFEMQKTFVINRRMARWKKNDFGTVTKLKESFVSKFEKAPTGLFKAWCSKCGKREFPNNEWQLKQGSSCCAVDYVPTNINA